MNASKSTHHGAGRLAAVTGAGGFIGSHLVQALLARGWRVRALVHYNAMGSTGHLQEVVDAGRNAHAAWINEDGLEIVAGDVTDAGQMKEFAAGADVVMHLAALIGIPYSYRAPQSYLNVNVQGTLNILEACRRCGTARLIHTSTSEALGTAQSVPQNEDHPLRAQSPYAASKLAADKFAEAYFHSFDLPVVTLRPFNTYGPRQSLRAIVPTILAQALSEKCRTIELGALDPQRDFTFVGDTVEAFLKAADAPLHACAGRVYHLGSGESISIGHLARKAAALLGVEKPIVSREGRLRPEASEVMALQSDNARARAELGWEPVVSFDEGLLETAEWLRARLPHFDAGSYGV